MTPQEISREHKDAMLEYRACLIATKAHEGQFRRDGVTPYIVHPASVAGRVKTPQEKAVAWLHDTLEDTKITADDLYASGLPYEVIEAVQLLTHDSENVPYLVYLDKIKSNPLAKAVKMADMLSNLADSPTDRQIYKYSKGLIFLLGMEQ